MNTYTHDSAEWLNDRNWLTSEAPFSLFAEWFSAAAQHEPEDPNAMALSTVDSQGMPNVRMVLLKTFDERGFVIFTNALSVKGQELLQAKAAAGVLHWKSMRRQVRFRGAVEQVSDAEADAYFYSRPRDSQIGAWASLQSQPLQDRAEFEARIAEYTVQFEGQTVPRPTHWTGFRIIPQEIEFWQDRPFRLHDRLRFMRVSVESEWGISKLYP